MMHISKERILVELFKILDLKHIKNQKDFKQFINLERYTSLIDKCLKEQDYFLIIAENSDKLIGFGILRSKIGQQ